MTPADIRNVADQFYAIEDDGLGEHFDELLGRLLSTFADVVEAVSGIAKMDSAECARDPFLCKALARQALARVEALKP